MLDREYYTEENMMTVQAVTNYLVDTVNNNIPISILRIGDSELAVILQDVDGVYKYDRFNVLAGCPLPNLEARERLVPAIKNADIVGIFPKENSPGMNPGKMNRQARYKTIMEFFDAYNVYPERIWSAHGSYRMVNVPSLHTLIKKFPPILIGNMINDFGESIEKHLKVKIPVIISCKDYFDIDRVVNEAIKYKEYRWAIVSAGVPAKIIVNELKLRGMSGLDIGKAINKKYGAISNKTFTPNPYYPWKEDIILEEVK